MNGEYYKTKESVDEYIKLAEEYDGRALIDKLRDFLPANSYLLEIGSGPGTDWKILNDFFNVVGSDYSAEFLKRLNAGAPKGDFLDLDAVTLTTRKKFDGIYSNKVLHHLTDIELVASIKRQCAILNPGGVICHSFWRGEGTESYKGLFVNYHSNEGIESLFADYFAVVFLENYKEFDDNDSILIIGRKK